MGPIKDCNIQMKNLILCTIYGKEYHWRKKLKTWCEYWLYFAAHNCKDFTALDKKLNYTCHCNYRQALPFHQNIWRINLRCQVWHLEKMVYVWLLWSNRAADCKDENLNSQCQQQNIWGCIFWWLYQQYMKTGELRFKRRGVWREQFFDFLVDAWS